MTIGLSNSAKRARNSGSLTNQDQGGGSRKAGLVYQVGRETNTSIAFAERGINRPLAQLQMIIYPLANITRPIGRNGNRAYWAIPGTTGGRGA